MAAVLGGDKNNNNKTTMRNVAYTWAPNSNANSTSYTTHASCDFKSSMPGVDDKVKGGKEKEEAGFDYPNSKHGKTNAVSSRGLFSCTFHWCDSYLSRFGDPFHCFLSSLFATRLASVRVAEVAVSV